MFRVERLADKQVYALKKVKLANLSEKEIENALNEVRILASLKNKNIIGYKEVFLEGKNLWYLPIDAASSWNLQTTATSTNALSRTKRRRSSSRRPKSGAC